MTDTASIRQLWFNTYWKEGPDKITPKPDKPAKSQSGPNHRQQQGPRSTWRAQAQKLAEQGYSQTQRDGPGDISSPSFYTALARNPYMPKESRASSRFDALTRLMINAPHWYDTIKPQSHYDGRRNIDVWKNEVVK